MQTGSCLCGAIRYEVSLPITELRACHCRDCQKVSGTAGTVNALIPTNALRITQGTPKRFTKKADSGRTLHRFFCGECGASLFSRREATPETTVLRAGAFDDPPAMKITAHIWTGSARPWAYIDPASARFPGQPDAPPVPK